MKYDWLFQKDMRNIYVIIICFFLCIWGVIVSTTSYYYKTRYRRVESELGNLRTELESANNRESEITGQLDRIKNLTGEAVEYVSREHDLLISTGTTIREIRAQVEDLERYCDSLELFIYSIRDNAFDNTKEIN